MQILKSQLARLPTRPGANQPHLACQAVTDTVTASLFPVSLNGVNSGYWSTKCCCVM